MRLTKHQTALILITLALLALGTGGAAAQALGFSWPQTLNTNADSDSVGANDLHARVTADGLGNWVATWYTGLSAGQDIRVSRSTDNGANWSPLATLHANYGNYHQGPCPVTTDGLGNWVAVWSSQENLGGTAGDDSDIFVARSTDNGATWTAPAALNTGAATDSADDVNNFGEAVTTDGLGNWLAVWTSDGGIVISLSTDNGATWTAPAALGYGGALGASPSVTTDGQGHWVVVWNSGENIGGAGTDEDIFVSISTDLVTTAVREWSLYR